MSFSNISATQRQQQEEALKKVLAISLLASTLLHGVALPLSLKLVKPAEFEEEAIEIVVLDEPKVEETKPEPTIPEKVSPPPETFKPEPPPEPTPAEEPPIAATPPSIPEKPPIAVTPPPIPEEQPVAATPPPIPEEPPVAVTPPPIPEEPPVAVTPPPIPEEQPVAVTPPPTPIEPSPPPQQDFNSPETLKTPIAQEPETPSPDPPKSEPPVTASRPKGAASLPDFTKDAGNPNSSDSPEKNNPLSSSPSGGSGEPSSEPLNPASGPIQRSPGAGSPVTATRPGGGGNSGNAIGDMTNPSSSDSPGGSASNSPSGASENGNIPSDEPFATGSGRSPRSPAAGSPVTGTRPGGGGNSGNGSGGLGNLASSGSPGGGAPGGGSPGGSASNSSPGGGGNGGGGSSGPFGSGSGPVPKPTNPGRGGSPSRPPGAPLTTCISGCGKPNYPIAAREEGREGRVDLICDVDPTGKTFNIKILTPSKYNDLNKAAMKTVEERKYAPSESGFQGEKISIIFDLTD